MFQDFLMIHKIFSKISRFFRNFLEKRGSFFIIFDIPRNFKKINQISKIYKFVLHITENFEENSYIIIFETFHEHLK